MQFQMSMLTSEDSILWCFQMLSEDCTTLLCALTVIYPIVISSKKIYSLSQQYIPSSFVVI